MNIKNPYVEFINQMRKHGAYFNPAGVEIGQINSTDPLEVIVDDLSLKKENLFIADYLSSNYKRQISIPNTAATGATTNGSISSISIGEGELDFKDGFNVGDSVALIKISDTKYLIFCKAVEA